MLFKLSLFKCYLMTNALKCFIPRRIGKRNYFQQQWDVFVRLILRQKNKESLNCARNCSVVTLSPQLLNCCADGSDPVNLTFFLI